MARPGGFEPPTAWFVARYSIQLSYGRAGFLCAVSNAYQKQERMIPVKTQMVLIDT